MPKPEHPIDAGRFVFLVLLVAVASLLLLLPTKSMQTATSANTFMVNSRTDSGTGSLREAISLAQPGDMITFDTGVFPSTEPMTITVLSELPTLDQGNITIDASNAGVVLDGQHSTEGTDGLQITSDGNVIQGLTILNFPNTGIELSSGASDNVIGGDYMVGSAPHGEGNIITANADCGVVIDGTGTMSNTVSGNLIGLDVDGTWDWRVRVLVISPYYAADQTLFIGTRYHGVWRSLDGGQSWSAVNMGLTNLDVRALVVSPDYATDHVLFAGTGGGEIFRSADGGTNWTQVYAGAVDRDVYAMAISPDFENDGHVFVATDGKGALISVDGGETWEVRNAGLTDGTLHDIEVSPNYASDQTVFAASWRAIFKSVDAGVSWQVLSRGAFTGGYLLVVSPDYATDQTLFLGMRTCDDNPAFWKSTDGGETWTSIGGDPGWCTLQSLAMAPDFATNHTLIAGDDWSGIFISHDAGETWSRVWEGRYTWALEFSPAYAQDHTVFAGQRAGTVFKSWNGGDAWSEVAQAITEPGNDDDGVRIINGAQYNVIGGVTSGTRNIISHNEVRGILIAGARTDHNRVLGNYIGTTSDGMDHLGNVVEGIVINDGARNNDVGGATANERNVISGNGSTAVSLWGTGTVSNVISGNYIGVDASGMQALINEGSGINLSSGVQWNRVGGMIVGERNILSGNRQEGVNVSGSGTLSNTIVGNYIGVDAVGSAAIGNSNGIVIGSGAQHNRIGGASPNERNIISGNRNNGVGIWETDTAYNTVAGNYIGLDATGAYSITNGDWGLRLSSGAHHNTIGGETQGAGNVISGNRWAGVGLTDSETTSNTVTNNIIGADATGTMAIGNEWGVTCWNDSRYHLVSENLIVGNRYNGINWDSCDYSTIRSNYIGVNRDGDALGHGDNGISLFNGAHKNMVGPGNVIAYNNGRGIGNWDPTNLYNTFTQNSIYDNAVMGIDNGNGGNAELTPPVITQVTTDTVRGVAPLAHVVVELFSDDASEGRLYEGHTLTDEAGFFVFVKPSGFDGPKVTATVTDGAGNTSEFSQPADAPAAPPQMTTGDLYETDDICGQARSIPANGVVQHRTFHDDADTDWVIFNALADTTYRIEGQVPPDSYADLSAELYELCTGGPVAEQDYVFAAEFSLEYTPAVDGPLYLRLSNHDTNVFGDDVAYRLSVRELAGNATPGAVIIVAGRNKHNDYLQENIYHVTDSVYQLFVDHAYGDDRIMYLPADLTIPRADAPATAANLAQAITTWAVDKVAIDRALTLYLVDHGVSDRFYLDKPNSEWVTPTELDGWLSQLEAAVPGVKINVIIEACRAGSFITEPGTLSKPGRVIITSTDAENAAWPSLEGAEFSDHFLAELAAGGSLYQSFTEARWAAQGAHPPQQAWLDDDGDGIFNEALDGQEAAQRGFNYIGTFAEDIWPPYIAQALSPDGTVFRTGTLRAEVRDEIGVKKVWIEVFPPSYVPPEAQEDWVTEVSITETLTAVTEDWYVGTYTGFSEPGVYRVVIHAEDVDGYTARPVAVEVQAGWQVYLPLSLKN